MQANITSSRNPHLTVVAVVVAVVAADAVDAPPWFSFGKFFFCVSPNLMTIWSQKHGGWEPDRGLPAPPSIINVNAFQFL